MSSKEITEWRAYERAFGLLDDEYVATTLGTIANQMQVLTYLFGQANYAEKNPVKHPIPWPTPRQVYLPREDSTGSEAEEAGGADELSAFFDRVEKQQK